MSKTTSTLFKDLYPARIVRDRDECEWGEQLPDGRIIVVKFTSDENDDYFLRYDAPFMLDGKVTTLNSITNKHRVFCYDEYVIRPFGDTFKLGPVPYKKIVAEFAEHGFNVSTAALRHNYDAWRANEKSGYLDESNGNHIFTPCGANPLEFRATTLHRRCRDWQKTYTW